MWTIWLRLLRGSFLYFWKNLVKMIWKLFDYPWVWIDDRTIAVEALKKLKAFRSVCIWQSHWMFSVRSRFECVFLPSMNESMKKENTRPLCMVSGRKFSQPDIDTHDSPNLTQKLCLTHNRPSVCLVSLRELFDSLCGGVHFVWSEDLMTKFFKAFLFSDISLKMR